MGISTLPEDSFTSLKDSTKDILHHRKGPDGAAIPFSLELERIYIVNEEDFLNFTSEGEENVNGISISAIRWVAEQFYPDVIRGGVYIDPSLDRLGESTPRGRIYLHPEICVEDVQENLSWAGIEIDESAAVWLVFLHEIAHVFLGHTTNDPALTDAEIEEATKFLKSLPQGYQKYHKHRTEQVTKQQDAEADEWAVQQFTMLTRKGVFDMLEREEKLQQLRMEQTRVAEEIAKIEHEENEKAKQLAEEKREADKVRLELKLRGKSLLWLESNWKKLPTFLNKCFEQLQEMAEEYDTLDTEGKSLYEEVQTLKGLLKQASGEGDANLCASIRNDSQRQVGASVALDDDLKHFLDCVINSRELWVVGEDTPLRFLDPVRRNPKTDW